MYFCMNHFSHFKKQVFYLLQNYENTKTLTEGKKAKCAIALRICGYKNVSKSGKFGVNCA